MGARALRSAHGTGAGPGAGRGGRGSSAPARGGRTTPRSGARTAAARGRGAPSKCGKLSSLGPVHQYDGLLGSTGPALQAPPSQLHASIAAFAYSGSCAWGTVRGQTQTAPRGGRSATGTPSHLALGAGCLSWSGRGLDHGRHVRGPERSARRVDDGGLSMQIQSHKRVSPGTSHGSTDRYLGARSAQRALMRHAAGAGKHGGA